MDKMVAIVCGVLAAVACVWFGRFTETFLVAGLLCATGLFLHQLRSAAFYTLMCAVSLAMAVSCESRMGCLLPGVLLWIARMILRDGMPASLRTLWVALLPVSLLFLGSENDRDVFLIISIALSVCIPVPHVPSANEHPRQKGLWLLGCGLFFVMSIVVVLPGLVGRGGKVAMFQGGVWAQSTKVLRPEIPLNIESMYSYSELREVLQANLISPAQLDTTYGEAWLIMPTKPLPEHDKASVATWIRGGGTLIVLTDHTDLFGHGRAVNDLLKPFGLYTSYTAFFPLRQGTAAQGSPGESVALKTSNIHYGTFLWPRLTARWFNEAADYSNKNFFGALRPSADDDVSRRTIAGYVNAGRGRIILMGDSTLAANFALYQPGTIPLLEQLRHTGVIPALLPIIWLAALAGGIYSLAGKRGDMVSSIAILGLWGILDFGRHEVRWPVFEWWSGDRSCVVEWGNPDQRASTAYAVAVLSGRKPRWADGVDDTKRGVWISAEPPPNARWRWLDIRRSDTTELPHDSRWDPFLMLVSAKAPLCWRMAPNLIHERIGGVWTDDAMGDWWFDRGISKAKHQRIDSWVAWLNEASPPFRVLPVDSGSVKLIPYALRIEGRDVHRIELPGLALSSGNEVLLGKGVSAEAVHVDGTNILYGNKPFTESWNAPSSWVLIPMEGGARP
ncbi:MAG: hypothetical protein HY360_11875 [Verrucomicrobia bacterium]|nr:hypothetical protein [Verrucomicrobiota bacterium]